MSEQAFYAQLKTQIAGSLTGSFAGGVHLFLAENAAMPYLIISPNGAMPFAESSHSGRARLVTQSVMFGIFHTSANSCLTLLGTVEKEFMQNRPSNCEDVQFVSRNVELDPDKTEEGEDVYHGILILDFVVQENPTA